MFLFAFRPHHSLPFPWLRCVCLQSWYAVWVHFLSNTSSVFAPQNSLPLSELLFFKTLIPAIHIQLIATSFYLKNMSMESLIHMSKHAPCSALSSLPRWHEQLGSSFANQLFLVNQNWDQNLVPLIISSVFKNIVYKQRNLRVTRYSTMFCFKTTYINLKPISS